MNNDLTPREERLKRIQDGFPVDPRVSKSLSAPARRTLAAGGGSRAAASGTGQRRGVEISDAAANLIAQALKTLLNS